MQETALSISERLARLNITLPPATKPSATYVPCVIAGPLVFVSGHTAKRDGQPWVGQLGRTMTTTQGQAAAHSVAIALLGTLQEAVRDLDRVERIVKLSCLVNSSPDFTEHHLVANGASELLLQVFGDAGRHARSAFGVAQVPHGACVEIEMIAELRRRG